MDSLTVSLIQTDLVWQDAGANRRMLGKKMAALEPSDLIVLPEMFTTGFSMAAPALAETMDGPTLNWLAQQAHQSGAVITGSLIIQENGNYYNRLIWMQPDGTCRHYDKRHLFRMAREQETFTPGSEHLVVELRGWRICPLICYDLRFPVWSRNRKNGYDLLLYVANWPEKRALAWKTLLAARAIENQAYVLGVNRLGEDGQGIGYGGDSAAMAYDGRVLWQQTGKAACPTLTLNKKALLDYRQSFPAYLDADDFTIR